MAALVGALVVFGAGVAGAAPRATIAITEYGIAAHGGNLGSKPADIAAGPDGNLWFSDQGTTKAIGRATPTGTISEFTISVPGNTSPLPNGIAAGPDGNLWFADRGTKKAIGQITPSGTITEFAITVAGSSPRGVAAGPDGNVWFTDDATVPAIGLVCLTIGPLCSPTDVANHAIHEYGVTANGGFAATPSPKGITAGPDGNLWFADTGTTKAIGWINPSTHAITEYTSDNPGDITAGPDGNLWFADQGDASPTSPASIAVVDLTPPVLTLPDPIFVDATGPAGATVSYAATAKDTLDPSPVVACVPASGSTFAIGTTTVNCTATDDSGNVASGSFSVHVKGAAEQLADLGDAVAGVGPGTSLADKVTSIEGYLAANDNADACGTLGAFINQVNAAKKIANPGVLIAAATQIETVLGCN